MNLVVLLDMAASGHGDRVALTTATERVTFTQLQEQARHGASVLHHHDAGTAVLVGRNGPMMPRLLFAAALAGVPFTALNYRLSSEQILEQIARLDQPVIVADDDYLHLVRHLDHAMSVSRFTGTWAGAAPYAASPDGCDIASQLFTSGTTAQPKIVALRHENLFSYVTGTVEFGGADPDEAALVCVPPYHVAALGSALTNLYAGRRVTYLPDFDPSAWLSLARREQVTTAMVVPTMLARIVDACDGAADVPTLRLISYGGSKMALPVLERALSAFPDCGFVNAYGLTETSSTITVLTPEDHHAALNSDDPGVAARLASAGRPVPGIELEVRDADGAVLPAGETGELWVRGPQVSGEYIGQGSVLDADGWFPTKDRARLDTEGYVFIDGRADDTIIRGGENIAPAEIEDVLLRHPGIADAVVVGAPDEEWGQRLVAVVVRRDADTITGDDVKAWVRSHVRGSRTPDDVVWRDDIPQTATGKILRRQIVAELQN
jgi:acyl-CoA synthetase (AMP-forming)/AMP-acid ligase II